MANQPVVQKPLKSGREEVVEKHCLSEASRKQYASGIGVYRKVCEEEMGIDAEPITEDNVRGFIMGQVDKGRKWTTITGYLAAFAWWFRDNGLPVETNSIAFRLFKGGLRRDMDAENRPNRKEAWLATHFLALLELGPMDKPIVDLFFMMTVMFHGFLRISEVVALHFSDVRVTDGVLAVTIRRSKGDQLAKGECVFIHDSGKPYSPFRFLESQVGSGEELIFPLSQETYRCHFLWVLSALGLSATDYSFHSFRRGGANAASLAGISDCVIKRHGRWKSEAYIVYCNVDGNRAGLEISAVI
jgi:integrase